MSAYLPTDPGQEPEAKLTALLLDELSEPEAQAVRQSIAKDAELARLYERLKQAIELVREAAGPVEQPIAQPAPLRLSDERREALLQRFKTVAPREFERSGGRRVRQLVPLAIAAVLVGCLLLAGLFLPALSKTKNKALRIALLHDGQAQQPQRQARDSFQSEPGQALPPLANDEVHSVAGRPAGSAPNIANLSVTTTPPTPMSAPPPKPALGNIVLPSTQNAPQGNASGVIALKTAETLSGSGPSASAPAQGKGGSAPLASSAAPEKPTVGNIVLPSSQYTPPGVVGGAYFSMDPESRKAGAIRDLPTTAYYSQVVSGVKAGDVPNVGNVPGQWNLGVDDGQVASNAPLFAFDSSAAKEADKNALAWGGQGGGGGAGGPPLSSFSERYALGSAPRPSQENKPSVGDLAAAKEPARSFRDLNRNGAPDAPPPGTADLAARESLSLREASRQKSDSDGRLQSGTAPLAQADAETVRRQLAGKDARAPGSGPAPSTTAPPTASWMDNSQHGARGGIVNFANSSTTFSGGTGGRGGSAPAAPVASPPLAASAPAAVAAPPSVAAGEGGYNAYAQPRPTQPRPASAGLVIDPATGQPAVMDPTTGEPVIPVPAVDPATGLPIAPAPNPTTGAQVNDLNNIDPQKAYPILKDMFASRAAGGQQSNSPNANAMLGNQNPLTQRATQSLASSADSQGLPTGTTMGRSFDGRAPETLAKSAPILGDLPIAGRMFRSKSEQATEAAKRSRGLVDANSANQAGDLGVATIEAVPRNAHRVEELAASLGVAGTNAISAGSTVALADSFSYSARLPNGGQPDQKAAEERTAQTTTNYFAGDPQWIVDLTHPGAAGTTPRTNNLFVGRHEYLLIPPGTALDQTGTNAPAMGNLGLANSAVQGFSVEKLRDAISHGGDPYNNQWLFPPTDGTTARADVEQAKKPQAQNQITELERQQRPESTESLTDAKRKLEEAERFRQILSMKLNTEGTDKEPPKTSTADVVERAQAQPKEQSSAWQRITGTFKSGVERRARIRVERDQSDIAGFQDATKSTPYDPYFISTESQLIQSEAVLGKAIEKLRLNEQWAQKYGKGKALTTEETMAILQKKLDIRPEQNTSVMDIGVKADKPEEAAQIANAIADAYAEQSHQKRRQLAEGGIQALEQKLAEQDKKVADAKTAVDRLQESQNATDSAAARTSDLTPRPSPTPPPVPQPEVQTTENAFSTFSLNVSDVSFKLAAASLEKGVMPDAASVRSEEFINAFDYRDPEAAPGAALAFAWERAAYPFAQNRDLLRFSIKTAAQGRQAGRPMNIVLLLDNSGSMERADRVSIIREALRVLGTQLQPQDRLSIVTFARTARLVVDGVPGNQAGQALEQVSNLTPQGGTNLEEAMKAGYETALRHYLPGGINRVVLLTDGAANLGNVQPDDLKKMVETNRKQGIALDCFGIGWEGYNDDLLEVLTRNGDGRYGFVNTPEEAATDFAGQLAGALHVAASDVKVQIEFNPARVTAYRQIGYAKHQLTKEQFRDNSVNAAQIAAAEAGNGLYVIAVNPAGNGPLATVRVRYRLPGTDDYREQEWTVPYAGIAAALDKATPAMRLAAVASAFSEWLATSPYASEVTPDRLLGYLAGVPDVYGADERPKKLEWMIRQAKSVGGK